MSGHITIPSITLAAGQTIMLGACGVSGSSGTGDTFLRLFDPGSANVANSDDDPATCGAGTLLSHLVFTASTAGVYQLRAGCFSSLTCNGTIAYTLSSNDGTGSFPYSASNTASATINTTEQPLVLEAGQTLRFGTCGIFPPNTGTGDTFLRLFGPDSEQATFNDDNPSLCGTGSVLSNGSFTVPAGSDGAYLLRGGCFSSGSCTGTVVFTVE
jgi:hypothetical protein